MAKQARENQEQIMRNKEGERNLYKKQLELFRQLAEEDIEEAINICGLWELHSLSPEEKMNFLEKLGFKPQQAQEFYNLGLRAALKGEYKEAEKFFKLAVEENPEFYEAIYNLALTYEHLKNMKKSLELWQLCVSKINSNHPDYFSIKSHIRSLKRREEEK